MDQNFWYLFSAYTLILVGLFLYLFTLAGREKKLETEIAELKAAVEALESKEDGQA
ncbi:MAG: CcmD family protein [Gemmatimonadetes bacterium]|nr:CcmD family protein [Gemmatimonadota bacterium]